MRRENQRSEEHKEYIKRECRQSIKMFTKFLSSNLLHFIKIINITVENSLFKETPIEKNEMFEENNCLETFQLNVQS